MARDSHFVEHSEDRDINAAQVNLIWARGLEQASLDEGLWADTGSAPCKPRAELPSSTSCRSMKQLGMLKRQKPRVQR